jgi:hypothetical protein
MRKLTYMTVVALMALTCAWTARVATAAKAAAKEEAGTSDHEIRRIMAQAADRAIGQNASDQLLDLVTKSDRDRIEKKIDKSEEKAYQEQADKVRKAWKAKYGHDFSAQGHVDMLGGLKPEVTGTGTDEEAVVKFPGAPGQGSYNLHLTREKSGYWRIQLPDTLNGDTFYKNMMKAVQKAADDVAKAPEDPAQAYQMMVTELLHEMAFPEGTAPAKKK